MCLKLGANLDIYGSSTRIADSLDGIIDEHEITMCGRYGVGLGSHSTLNSKPKVHRVRNLNLSPQPLNPVSPKLPDPKQH